MDATRPALRLALLAFTVIYAVMLVTLGNGISRSLGSYIADSTSEWHYVSVDRFNDLMASGQLNSSNLQVIELGPYANYRDALGTTARLRPPVPPCPARRQRIRAWVSRTMRAP